MISQNTSDLSGSFRLRYLNNALKRKEATLGNELASGRVSDVSKNLSGGVDRLGALSRSIRMMATYDQSITELKNRATGLQAGLSVIAAVAETNSGKLLTVATTPTDSVLAVTSKASEEGLKSVVGTLNTQLAGRSLFSGTAFDRPAVKSAASILDDLTTLTAGATTSVQVIQAVDDYFNQPGGGYETSAYLGDNTSPGAVSISDSKKANISVTARDSRLRKPLQGLALASLLGRGILSGDTKARANILKQAGTDLIEANDGLINLRAEIGGKQERLDTISLENQAGKTAMQEMVNTMIKADGYETATSLQAVQTGLEALYISTSRLSQLSLVRFLK